MTVSSTDTTYYGFDAAIDDAVNRFEVVSEALETWASSCWPHHTRDDLNEDSSARIDWVYGEQAEGTGVLVRLRR